MMVAGKLDARGRGPNDIKFTLSENVINMYDANATIDSSLDGSLPVRLFGGKTQYEGRLQVRYRVVNFDATYHLSLIRVIFLSDF